MMRIKFFRFLLMFFLLAGMGAAASSQERNVVLLKGNQWVRGFPGFDAGAVSALYGEYRLETAGTAPAAPIAVFSIWLSMEPLFFREQIWERRPGITGFRAVQRGENGDLLVALPSGGGNLNGWTILFQFPGGLSGMNLDNEEADRLIGVWTNRFLYFYSLIKSPADVSLPAVVGF
jgi:hypothetical protein